MTNNEVRSIIRKSDSACFLYEKYLNHTENFQKDFRCELPRNSFTMVLINIARRNKDKTCSALKQIPIEQLEEVLGVN